MDAAAALRRAALPGHERQLVRVCSAARTLVQAALEKITVNSFGKSTDAKKATQWYSVFASGPGIFGLGSRVYSDDAIFARYDPKKTDIWSLKNPDHVNGGVNHFGSPFNFPEEFVTVYRLHAWCPT